MPIKMKYMSEVLVEVVVHAKTSYCCFLVTIIRELQVAPDLQTVNVVCLFDLYQIAKGERYRERKTAKENK